MLFVDSSVLAGWGIVDSGSCWFIWRGGVCRVGLELDAIEGVGLAGM